MQEVTAISLQSAAAAALQAARAASTHSQLQQQPSHPLQALTSATSGLDLGLLPSGLDRLLTDHTQQQLVESQAASALDVHADVSRVSYAPGQAEAWSSKHSVATEADQLSSALAAHQQQQQKQLLHEGPNLPWSSDDQADSPRPQEQQQQSLEALVSGTQISDAGGVEGAGGGQDEAAKTAYRKWSASFEARLVSQAFSACTRFDLSCQHSQNTAPPPPPPCCDRTSWGTIAFACGYSNPTVSMQRCIFIQNKNSLCSKSE